ncbi:MAG: ABC transporter transmembrane domain-containing protein, partial [Gammaproteobacteria bacterium]|nr:ABC transporter transmembrane domain-containing protein [Gammaproteobacteria bacterium]
MNQDDDIVKSIKLSSLWRLLRYALAYPRLLKEAAVLLLLATLGQVLGPVLVKIFIDDYITPGEYPIRELATLAFAYAVFYGLSAWAGYQNAMRFNEVAFSVVRTVRAQVFAAVMRKPLSYLRLHRLKWVDYSCVHERHRPLCTDFGVTDAVV